MNKIIGKISDAGLKIETTILGAGPRGSRGPMGTTNYNLLANQPKIEEITLIGNKTFEELGFTEITEAEIERMF